MGAAASRTRGCLSILPEAFEEEESSLEQMIKGSDREIGRRLARLSDRLSAMALWHEQKAQMLHGCHPAGPASAAERQRPPALTEILKGTRPVCRS